VLLFSCVMRTVLPSSSSLESMVSTSLSLVDILIFYDVFFFGVMNDFFCLFTFYCFTNLCCADGLLRVYRDINICDDACILDWNTVSLSLSLSLSRGCV